MKIIYSLIIIYLSVGSVITGSSEYNVKDYGAVGNGIVLDTKSIQNTIDEVYKKGGGTVLIQKGTYKVGTLFLKDNVNLHLEIGATLLGSSDIQDYSEITYNLESRTNKLYVKYAVIFAEGVKNISITGFGTINGNGKNNFQITRPQNMRPFLVRFVNCKNVKIKDVRMLESANWTLHLLGCKDVVVDGIEIANVTENGNRDGLDIDACNNVFVSNCKISSIDDAIVLKSTNNKKCENIAITNCILSSHASAIKTGTESNGGFKNIVISNCVIKNIPVHAGIELMTVDGGNLQNVAISDIIMDNVATPIFIYLGNRARPFKKGQYVSKVAKVNGVYLNNITVTNAKLPSGVVGLNNRKVKNISFSNISVKYSKALKEKPLAVNGVPYKDLDYPMAIMFGTNLPAYSFYCRNVNGLSFNNVTVYSAKEEKRPAFIFDDINNLELNSIKTFGYNLLSPMVYLRNSDDVYCTQCRTLNKTETLFEIEKQSCRRISFSNNFLQDGQKEIVNVKTLTDSEKFADIEMEQKYLIKDGNKTDGLVAKKIAKNPIAFEFKITKKTTPQICILIKSNSDYPSKVILKYKNIEQKFIVDWNNWGWAPIALIPKFDKKEKIKFVVEAADKNSKLFVSKIYLKDLKLGYTD